MDFKKLMSIREEFFDDARPADIPLMKQCIDEYLDYMRVFLENTSVREAKNFLFSAYNQRQQKNRRSCSYLGMWIKTGDVIYADFGSAYDAEIGYQHPALVMGICCGKALVIPMSSNPRRRRQAVSQSRIAAGGINLMAVDNMPGLDRASVLYLNDVKFINTARVIKVEGNIDPKGELFFQIRERMMECIKQQES